MPGSKYASIKRPRVYEALRKRGYPKDKAAAIANSTPKKKKAAAVGPQVIAPTGPGGLLPRGLARKADGPPRTFVRSDDGRFSETPGGGGGGGKTPEAAPPKAETPAAAPPQGADATTTFLADLGLDPKLADALGEYLSAQASDAPEDIALNRAAAEALQAQGLVTIASGQEGANNLAISLTGAGKKLQKAVGRGDIAGGMKVVEAGHKKAAAAVAKKKPGAAAADTPKKGGGSGGGSNDPDSIVLTAAELAARRGRLQALLGRQAGARLSGTLTRQEQAAAKKQTTKAMRPRRKRLWQTTYAEAKRAGHAPAEARKRASVALKKADAAKAQRHYARAVGRLSVLKAADGRHRWILRTTTSFRDRDKEILSLRGLIRDADRMTKTKQYGPLRYWHAGYPNEADPVAPWGPGLDLGMCDYSTVIGRTAIESGTFYDEQIAAAIKASAANWESSPGFFHPEAEPDADGVFWTMHRFERSLVPSRRAQASNLFTGLAVKEHTMARDMTPEEFTRRVNSFYADMTALGVDSDTLTGVLQTAARAEKTADAQRVAYKEAAPTPSAVYTGPDGQPGLIVEGRFVALKATTAKAPMSPEEMMAAGGTEMEDGAADAAEDMAEGEGDSILSPADVDMIASAVVAKLMSAIDEVSAKMAATDEELKMRGYSRMKETQDQLAVQVADLTAALKELTGDIPAGQAQRATQAARTTIKADDPTVQTAAANAGAETAAPALPADPVAVIADWMQRNAGGQMPWSIAGAQPALGVDPAQHAAPGVRQP